MKKAILVFCLSVLSIGNIIHAQIEIKASPFYLPFRAAAVGVEYGLNDHIGLELDRIIGLGWDGQGLSDASVTYLLGKYYFRPRTSLDRFFLGAYGVTGKRSSPGAGLAMGTKAFFTNSDRLFFEFGVGMGRSFNGDDTLPWLNLHLGYRFNK